MLTPSFGIKAHRPLPALKVILVLHLELSDTTNSLMVISMCAPSTGIAAHLPLPTLEARIVLHLEFSDTSNSLASYLNACALYWNRCTPISTHPRSENGFASETQWYKQFATELSQSTHPLSELLHTYLCLL